MSGQQRITARNFDARIMTTGDPMTSGEIRRIRLEAGMTQPIFAKVLGVHRATVDYWERGERTPSGSARRLLSLARARGMTWIL